MSVARLHAAVDDYVRLVALPTSVRAARDVVERAARAIGFDEQASYDFKLAASEAVANAIEHGKPCKDGCIGMRVREEGPGDLTVSVCDCGQFGGPRTDPAELPERGRGIAVISVLMDEVELLPRSDGTVVRMRKRLAT